MYRIALIGCGRIAPAHLEGLKALTERAQVVAICDMNEELRAQRQQEYGVPHGFGSIEALLDWDAFDIAVVLTPPNVRETVCLPLLGDGKHLLVEKPFTHSLEEAHRIVEAAQRAGVTLAVGQNFRWMPPAPSLRAQIQAGRIGKVLSYTQIDAVWRDEPAGWRSTMDKLALSVMGVHWLDRIRWITGGEGRHVYTSSLVSGLLTSAGEDVTSTVITLQSGAVVTLVHHWASHARGQNNSLQIDGTEGSVLVKGSDITWIDQAGESTREHIDGIPLSDSMTASWTELLDALDHDRQPCHSGRDNLWTIALLVGAYRSAEIGQSVVIKGN